MGRAILFAVMLAVTSQSAWASAWSPMERANYIYFDQAPTGAPDITVSPVTGLPYVVFPSCWDPSNGNNIIVGFAKGTRVGRTIDWS